MAEFGGRHPKCTVVGEDQRVIRLAGVQLPPAVGVNDCINGFGLRAACAF
jgi:hypothetical protein